MNSDKLVEDQNEKSIDFLRRLAGARSCGCVGKI
jgi:hypothetical protein